MNSLKTLPALSLEGFILRHSKNDIQGIQDLKDRAKRDLTEHRHQALILVRIYEDDRDFLTTFVGVENNVSVHPESTRLSLDSMEYTLDMEMNPHSNYDIEIFNKQSNSIERYIPLKQGSLTLEYPVTQK